GPSWLYAITGNNRYIVSAAEGFVLISGIVMGLAYRPTAERLGFEAMTLRALERAFHLYLLFVGLTFAMTGLALLWGAPTSYPILDPLAWVAGVLTLRQSSYLTDVMLVVAVAPFFFLAFRRQHTTAALACSWLLWAIYQIGPDKVHVPWPIDRQDAFPFAAWQALFVTGLAVGYHRQTVSRFVHRLPLLKLWLVPALLAALAGLMALNRIDGRLQEIIGGPIGAIIGESFYKFDVRPGRVMALAVVFLLAYSVLTALWRPLNAVFGWLLLPLGQHALDAYSAHIFFVVALGALRTQFVTIDALSITPNTLVQLSCVLIIWGMLKFGVIDALMGRERERPHPTTRVATGLRG
ncbi:MAG: OpgC domain-containing protein, partial [Dehalococcoidia bacterium]|nr:OpgC domain-containing protein [Dehalococcoidia bacterium]